MTPIRWTRLVAPLGIAALVAGCGLSAATPGGTDSSGSTQPSTTSSTSGEADRPPNLVVTSDDERLDMEPTGFCWQGRPGAVCVDGEAPDPLPKFDNPTTEIGLEYPHDWPMTVYINRDGGGLCPLERLIQVMPNGGGFLLPAPAGRHVIDVEAVGDQGQGVWTFAVETTTAGDPPPPHAEVRWYEGLDDSEPGVTLEVVLWNLGEKPQQMAIDVLVTDADGDSSAFSLDPNLEDPCWAGVVFAQGGPSITGVEGGEATYDVEVNYVLDGVTWEVEPFRWPNDAMEDLNKSEWLAAHPAD